jgi:hypothetical protein
MLGSINYCFGVSYFPSKNHKRNYEDASKNFEFISRLFAKWGKPKWLSNLNRVELVPFV